MHRRARHHTHTLWASFRRARIRSKISSCVRPRVAGSQDVVFISIVRGHFCVPKIKPASLASLPLRCASFVSCPAHGNLVCAAELSGTAFLKSGLRLGVVWFAVHCRPRNTRDTSRIRAKNSQDPSEQFLMALLSRKNSCPEAVRSDLWGIQPHGMKSGQ